MTYTVYTSETVTGKVIGTLPCLIQSWQRPLGGHDTAQVNINPGTLTVDTRDFYRLLTTPQRSTLIIDWDGIIMWAGPLTAREPTSQNTSQVKLSAVGIKTLLTRRKAHTWATPYAAEQIAYTGISLGQTAINLLGVATNSAKAGASLPIVVPSGTETSTDTTMARTYNGYELKDIGTELDNVTASLNGPDIDFQPEWTDGTRTAMQWVMRVGTISQPQLFSHAPVSLDVSSPKSSVQWVDVIEDASQLTTTQWANGAGSAGNTIMARAQNTGLIGQGWPLLENQKDYKSETDQTILQSHAQADLITNGQATEQWTIAVDAQSAPQLGSFLLGDHVTIRVASHWWIPDNVYTKRIIGITGDNTPTVKLDVQ